MNREDLIKQLNELKAKERSIRKDIEDLDYEERFEDAKTYEGRSFKEVDTLSRGNVTCIYVYDTCKVNCVPIAVRISYWEETCDHFSIEYYGSFYPSKYGDSEEWEEVDKKEFDIHYAKVQELVSKSVRNK